MKTLKYKGYTGTVEYSKEDSCLFGIIIDMNKNVISYEGKTVEELKADFGAGVDLYLESSKERGASNNREC